MNIIFGLIAFLYGSVAGSFLNVVILRHGKASINGRSNCPHCNSQLRLIDLIPILSFIFLRGRCHKCKKSISIQYPIIELASGLSALIIFSPMPLNIETFIHKLLLFIIVAILIVLFVIDLRTMILPDRFVISLSAIVLILTLSFSSDYLSSLYGILVGSGFLAILWLFTRGQGLGVGDIKLMIPLGAFFGFTNTIVLLFTAFVVGGVVASYLLLSKRVSMKTAVPFGPFLAGAGIIFILAPDLVVSISRWVLG